MPALQHISSPQQPPFRWRTARLILLPALTLFLLGGCGQKGDLYLPGKAKNQKFSSAQVQPTKP